MFGIVSSVLVASFIMFYAINAMGLLRVSAEGEMQGLDLHEHGISAYPEYVISSTARRHSSRSALQSATPPRRCSARSSSRD